MKLFKKVSGKKTRFRALVIFLIAGLIAGAAWMFLNPGSTEAAWYNGSWGYRKQLVIDHNKVSGGADLSSFPVLVSLTDPTLNSALSSGNDILFTSSDGTTKLSHEIEKYEQGTGTLIAWVKIPTLSSSTDTVIYLYWGNSGASNQQDATNVWDSNYKAVWHLNQANGSTRADSTSNANTLSENGTGGVGMGSSKVDGYAIFSRASTQYLNRTNAAQTGLGITGNITVEAWINSNDITDSTNNVFLTKDGSSGNAGYNFRAPNSKVAFKISNDGTASTTATGATTLSSNTWYHVVGVYNGTNILVYLNGAQDGSTAYSSGIFATTANVVVGGRNTGQNLWDGFVDEARISNTNRSAGWIATEYANQSSPSTFYTTGTSEEKNSPVLYWKFNDATGSTAQDSTTYNNDGTLGASTAAPTWQTEDACVVGKCLKFDGSNDKVTRSYATDTELDPGTASFSYSAWFRHPNAVSSNEMIITRSGAAGYSSYMDSAGEICGEIYEGANDDTICSTALFNDSKWHHLEFVKSGTTSITLYVDGKQVAQDTSLASSGSLTTSNATFNVGVNAAGSGGFWNGYLDEVKYYDYARSAAQVKSDFVSKGVSDGVATTFGASGADTALSQGLIGYWKMDESAANSCTGGTNDSCDSSGNAKDLAWSGSTTTAVGKFGNSTAFDGTDDYAGGGDVDDISGSDSFSVAFWIYRNNVTAQNQIIIDKKGSQGASSSGYQIYQWTQGNGGNTCFYVSDQTTQYETCTADHTTETLNTWEHITAVFDRVGGRGSSTIYINGIDQEFAAYELNDPKTLGNTISNSLGLCFGVQSVTGPGCSTGGTTEFNGRLDDVRMYNRALSPAEARNLYSYAPGPVGYWKFDEKTGQDINDYSGNSNAATVGTNNSVNTNDPTWTNGKVGGALSFDGIDDFVNIAGNPSSLRITGGLTLSAWINFQGSDRCVIHKMDSAGGTFAYSLETDSTKKLLFSTSSNGSTLTQVTGNTVLTNGSWYYVTSVYEPSTSQKVYVNGILDGTNVTSIPSSIFDSTGNVNIGAQQSGASCYAQGMIDDVKIYNYPRTAKQIVSDMNAGHPAVGSPVGSATSWWSFDEGFGTTANDKSVNTNSLTLSTASWTNSGKFGKAWNGTGSLWLTRADDDDFDFAATDDFTISTWFKSDSASNPAAATAQFLISKGTITNTGTVGYAIWLDNSGFANFGIRSTSGAWGASSPGTPSANDTASTTTDIYDGTWHNLVATKTGTSRIDLYIDGVLKGSDTSLTATGTLANSIALRVADDDADATNSFAGDLDEMKIYRYALNADEIKVEYNQGKAQVLGALSTLSNGITADNSSDRSYCIPGDTASCSAPVGEWGFNEGSSTTTNDTSGNANTGTLNTGPIWTRGKIGKGIQFDGTDDDVTVGTGSTLNLSNSMTVEAWIYPTSYGEANYGSIMARGPGAGSGFEFEVINDGAGTGHTAGLDINGAGQDIAAQNNIITLNTWQHVAVSITSNVLRFYVNGSLVNNASGTSSTTFNLTGAGTVQTYIGSLDGAGDTFQGVIDEVKMYNYGRTASQIAWDYNRGSPIAWWKFDECSGSTVRDSSGNSLDGTITIDGGGTNTTLGSCNSGTTTESWNNGTVGKFNSSFDADGNGDLANVADNNILDLTSDFTLSAWINREGDTTGQIISKTNGGTSGGYAMLTGISGEVYCRTNNGTTSTDSYTANGLVTSGTGWHHVAAVRTGSSCRVWVDGIDRTNTTGTHTTVTANALALRIASRPDGTELINSKIDDARIYNYALTSAQIKTLYNENFASRFGPATGSP